ncbi:MAG: OprO/OprP family phosphate-selective porin [Pseudomonadales bacterium]|nr:OprO/OprP family phosphate-selective porin [Pseudomonadales bacterium]
MFNRQNGISKSVEGESLDACASERNSTTASQLTAGLSKLAGVGLVCLASSIMPASAGYKMELDETRWLSVGAGIRTAFTSTEDAAPDGDDRANDFDVQSIRLYFNGQVHDKIKFTLNTEEIFSDGPVDILDAFVQFELNPYFNIWLGRMLTPADRIEMNGPYYGLSWNQYTQPLYPSDQGGDAGSYGRDDGITVWGAAGKFQYAFGIFDGLQGLGNQEDDLLFAGRFAYNFLNMESNPGYYTSSTYYGSLGNILTLGVSFQTQDSGTGSELTSGDFDGYTVDLLSETVFSGGGVLNIEAEYKDFDADYTLGTPTGDAGGEFLLFDGESYFVTVAFMFAGDGFGRFQPYVRYVENEPNDGDSTDLVEAGLNYVISGHNARINFNVSSGDANITGYKLGDDVDSFSFGVQLQF